MVIALRKELSKTSVQEDIDFTVESLVSAQINEVRKVMLQDFNQRWPVEFKEIYLIAALLDPRVKNLEGIEDFQRKEAIAKVKADFESKKPRTITSNCDQKSFMPVLCLWC